MADDDVLEMRITQKGFRTTVAMALSGEVGEYTVEPPRQGSLLALAVKVADRCREICAVEEVEMNDEVYEQAVGELAPHWLEPDE